MVEKEELTDTLYLCACFGEGLVIGCDEEDKEIYLSIWSFGRGKSPLTWSERLRYAWQIITKGKPYDDAIIFDIPTAKAFNSGLQELIARIEEK